MLFVSQNMGKSSSVLERGIDDIHSLDLPQI